MALELPGRLLSYDDYAAIDDGHRYQVVDGVLVMSPTPNRRHQYIVLHLGLLLAPFVEREGLGEVAIAPLDVVLKAERPAVVVQPDVMFVSRARRDLLTPANIQGAPDLVVEVLSPGTVRMDMGRKQALYAAHGVREYWVVPYEFDRIEVRTLGVESRFGKPQIFEPGDRLTTPLLPGLELDVAAIFPEDDEERAGER